MKYYLVVGEASGDLHASNLMAALRDEDVEAEFRFYGGDCMKCIGGTCVKHYSEMAYMGFIPVLMHLRTIWRNMKYCKQDICQWKPDVVILVDYPGFNLKIANYVKRKLEIPVYYYISPKLWAWKEYRIKNIKADVDELFSILPFEVDFFKKHNYPIHYVGNPCVDSIKSFKRTYCQDFFHFTQQHKLSNKPILALLAGSRQQEINDNLPLMLSAALPYKNNYQIIVAGAPGVDASFYNSILAKYPEVAILFNQTYPLLSHAKAAMVTSGTATLETALLHVPQVVCYYVALGRLVSLLRKLVLKVKYISLVNLITGKRVVRELVADEMTLSNLQSELHKLLHDDNYRLTMLQGYNQMNKKLGSDNVSSKAAHIMVSLLRKQRN